jgi:deoxyribose-phosphate aldolase
MHIAKYIDHTLLKPEATPAQVVQLCSEAKRYEFASVCVNPSYVVLATHLLHGQQVKICTVIGFPLGMTKTVIKVAEASAALAAGAQELDMVINVGMLKAGEQFYVENEIASIVALAHKEGAIVKVIIETALLSDDEKRLACTLARSAGADFVKTSTGFSGGGATVDDVKLMRATVGPLMGVKASGGISDYVTAQAMIDAGATRIGTSKGVAIVKGAPPDGSETH